MFGKKKKEKLTGVVELSPQEADAIIASGSSQSLMREGFYYDYGKNQEIQMTLNKLHGK